MTIREIENNESSVEEITINIPCFPKKIIIYILVKILLSPAYLAELSLILSFWIYSF